MNGQFRILIEISLKYVPKRRVDINPALIYIMTWGRIGDKPLSEPMLTRLTDTYTRHYGEMSEILIPLWSSTMTLERYGRPVHIIPIHRSSYVYLAVLC